MMLKNLSALCLAFGLAALTACQSPADPAPSDAPAILIFSHTTGWRHASIETGIAALTALAEDKGYSVEASEDPDIFSRETLADFDALILLNSTTGHDGEQWFNGPRGEALQAYLHDGNAVVAVHGAADSHYDWPWYGQMIGGYFERHPEGTPTGELAVTNANHPSTEPLPAVFSRTDEWYWIKDFTVPEGLLITLDPASIGEGDGPAKPVSWAHEFEGGRVFYTSMGHTSETYSDPLFLAHLGGGLDWALGRAD